MADTNEMVKLRDRRQRNEGVNMAQNFECPQSIHHSDPSESSEESTSWMYSGKKRKRNLSRSNQKQRYLKTKMPSQLDFFAANAPQLAKTKKQYWTEAEVSFPHFRQRCQSTRYYLNLGRRIQSSQSWGVGGTSPPFPKIRLEKAPEREHLNISR